MKEDNFSEPTKSTITNPNYNQAEGFVSPNSVNSYLFCSHVYEGSGGIKDGSYLVPFERELFYQKRKSFSAYRNFFKPIINAVVDPVFSNRIVRQTTNNLFESFIDNCDNRGTDLNFISKEAAILARLHGVCFAVLDNFQDIPETKQIAIDQRKFPYVYLQPAYNVDSYEEDGFNQLKSITFNVKPEIIDKKKYNVKVIYDEIAITKVYIYESKVVKTVPVIHGLNVLPVIPIYFTGNNEVLPPPPYYDIAKLNLCLFNKDSELRDQERAQAFSIFYAQIGGSNNNITVGPHSMINLPSDPNITITPGYASPDSSILSHLTDSADKYIDNIFRAAQQAGIVGIKQASSGISEAYRFTATNEQLKMTSTVMQDFELKLADLFSLYINEPVEYICNYTKEFNTFYNVMSVDDVVKLLNIDFPEDVKKEIKKSAISKVLNHLDPTTLNDLYKQI